MRATFLLLIIVFAAGATFGQSDLRTTAYKGPARAALPCRDQDLSVRHVTEDAAMGGLRTIDYAFKNKSASACTLKGYPRFELIDKSGAVRPRGRAINSQQLPGDESKQPPQFVTIEARKEAGFKVYYNTGGAGYMGKPCPMSRKVRISAPGTTRRFVLREPISSCGKVEVSAVRREVRSSD